jgi:hypothetical protein
MIVSAPSAIAAEKLKLSVGGYMEQWFGYVSADDVDGQDYGGFDIKSDAEIHFKGKTKLDNGISVGVNVQLEASQNGDQIDEAYMHVDGGFGQIIIGDENSAMYKMHYAPSDYGIGINSGDVTAWNATIADAQGDSIDNGGSFRAPFGATYIEPNGRRESNDSTKISYFTPRFGFEGNGDGFQLGVSYAPDGKEDNNGMPNRDAVNSDFVMVGANWKQKMGGMSVKISGGYGTVTDTAEATEDGTDTKDEPEAMSFGIVLGVGGLSGGVSYANHSDHGADDAEGINAGVAYAQDGWGISLAYFHGEKDGARSDGTPASLIGQAESDVIHLSGKYAMGPGVTLAGTLGHSEYTSKDAALDNTVDEVSATYLVMGLKVGF